MRLTDKQREWLILQETLLQTASGKADKASRKWRAAKADLIARSEQNGWSRTVLDQVAETDTDLIDAAADEAYFSSEVVRRSAAIVGATTVWRTVAESDDEIERTHTGGVGNA